MADSTTDLARDIEIEQALNHEPRDIICIMCQGTGQETSYYGQPCSFCKGTGYERTL